MQLLSPAGCGTVKLNPGWRLFRLADGDVFLPLGLCQGAGHFIDEDGGSEEFMDCPLVFIAQPDGFRRERAGNDRSVAEPGWRCGDPATPRPSSRIFLPVTTVPAEAVLKPKAKPAAP
jgi:hypothetical protein